MQKKKAVKRPVSPITAVAIIVVFIAILIIAFMRYNSHGLNSKQRAELQSAVDKGWLPPINPEALEKQGMKLPPGYKSQIGRGGGPGGMPGTGGRQGVVPNAGK